MKRVISVAAVLAIICALALVGCGSSGSSRFSGPVYLPTKATHYDYKGEVSYVTSTTYDERGVPTGGSTKWTSSDIEDSEWSRSDGVEYNDFGYTEQRKDSDGNIVKYENTYENGLLVKSASPNGDTTDYEYYDNGVMRKSTFTNGTNRNVVEYDEDGYLLSSAFYGEYASSIKYTWKKDSNGKPEGFISESDSSVLGTLEYTCFCDDNGLITAIYDDKGQLDTEFEYVEIEKPCNSAWVNAHQIRPY